MALNPNLHFHSLPQFKTSKLNSTPKFEIPLAISTNSNNFNSNYEEHKKPTKILKLKTDLGSQNTQKSKLDDQKPFPTAIPKKPRRGRPSEASAFEDFIRNSLQETIDSIYTQNSVFFNDNVIKEKNDGDEKTREVGDDKTGEVVDEVDPNWPVDAEVGWGIRASEYFEKHPIKNVIGEDGVEIDWEGELDDNLVKEINYLEWESFAFHPSPLIVLVFERYNRASDNWRALKELEKAAKVYWNAKDRLPPRTVKLDMNIETDLAYALKIRECPQLLFLRGNRIIYREPQIRTADELVQMIAHFYYKAKKPSWMKDAKLY